MTGEHRLASIVRQAMERDRADKQAKLAKAKQEGR